MDDVDGMHCIDCYDEYVRWCPDLLFVLLFFVPFFSFSDFPDEGGALEAGASERVRKREGVQAAKQNKESNRMKEFMVRCMLTRPVIY